MDDHAPTRIDRPAAPPTHSPTPQSAGQYEFTTAQNKVMEELEVTMFMTGILIGIGALAAGWHFVREIVQGHFPYGTWIGVGIGALLLLACFYSVWCIRAAKAFEHIHKTRGNDIGHLMNALRNIRNLFFLPGLAGSLLILGALIGFVVRLFF